MPPRFLARVGRLALWTLLCLTVVPLAFVGACALRVLDFLFAPKVGPTHA